MSAADLRDTNLHVGLVVPAYKSVMSESERFSLRRCIQLFAKYGIALCAPQDLDLSAFLEEYPAFQVLRFPAHYFASIDGYNRLMLSEAFYIAFEHLDYILIYQLDAYAFSDRLLEFCSCQYDYIGAPWQPPLRRSKFRGAAKLQRIFKWLPVVYECDVGNGGFSLRRPTALLAYLRRHRRMALGWKANEDYFWAVAGKRHPKEMKIAPLLVARDFAFEQDPSVNLELNQGRLPFGCHAFEKYEPETYRRLFVEGND